MISLDKCYGSCNIVDDLPTKICVPSKTKDKNVKVCNMITKINEAKTSVKDISCDCKLKFNSAASHSNEKWNINKYLCECKRYYTCKKYYSWNSSSCICEMVSI